MADSDDDDNYNTDVEDGDDLAKRRRRGGTVSVINRIPFPVQLKSRKNSPGQREDQTLPALAFGSVGRCE